MRVEPLLSSLLVPALDKPSILLSIEYSEKDESMILTTTYNGDKYDFMTEGNDLSVKLVRNALSDVSYSWSDEGERKNKMVMHIKAE